MGLPRSLPDSCCLQCRCQLKWRTALRPVHCRGHGIQSKLLASVLLHMCARCPTSLFSLLLFRSESEAGLLSIGLFCDGNKVLVQQNLLRPDLCIFQLSVITVLANTHLTRSQLICVAPCLTCVVQPFKVVLSVRTLATMQLFMHPDVLRSPVHFETAPQCLIPYSCRCLCKYAHAATDFHPASNMFSTDLVFH
jgi:hypothetical protein